jgi:hypothetical protein
MLPTMKTQEQAKDAGQHDSQELIDHHCLLVRQQQNDCEGQYEYEDEPYVGCPLSPLLRTRKEEAEERRGDQRGEDELPESHHGLAQLQGKIPDQQPLCARARTSGADAEKMMEQGGLYLKRHIP